MTFSKHAADLPSPNLLDRSTAFALDLCEHELSSLSCKWEDALPVSITPHTKAGHQGDINHSGE